MMNKKIYVVLFTLLLALSLSAQSSIEKVGTAGYQFLKITHGGRGVAMGDALGPVAGDASAVFWNPARLNMIQDYSVFVSHTEYLVETQVEAFALSKRFAGLGVVGINLVYMNLGDIEETTVFQQNGTGRTFTPVSYAVGLSFARMLTTKFGIGANVKYVNEDLTSGLGMDNSTGAWAVDIGTIYYPNFSNLESLRLAMSVKHFGPEVQLSGDYLDYDDGQLLSDPEEYKLFPLPLTFEFGVALDPFKNDFNRLTVSVVGQHPNDNSERLNLGAEYAIREMFALRGGYIVNHDTRGMNAGLGLNLGIFGDTTAKLDYGYAHFGVLADIHVLSFSFDW
jgi:hypothetical protein